MSRLILEERCLRMMTLRPKIPTSGTPALIGMCSFSLTYRTLIVDSSIVALLPLEKSPLMTG
jgi:hypothetical protein